MRSSAIVQFHLKGVIDEDLLRDLEFSDYSLTLRFVYFYFYKSRSIKAYIKI